MFDWSLRGKDCHYYSVLCYVNSCAQWYAYACEQVLNFNVGLDLLVGFVSVRVYLYV